MQLIKIVALAIACACSACATSVDEDDAPAVQIEGESGVEIYRVAFHSQDNQIHVTGAVQFLWPSDIERVAHLDVSAENANGEIVKQEIGWIEREVAPKHAPARRRKATFHTDLGSLPGSITVVRVTYHRGGLHKHKVQGQRSK